MKQAILRNGVVSAMDVPDAVASDGGILVRIEFSCISAGTEMSGVKSSSMNLVERALKQPQNVIKVYENFRQNGLSATFKKVKAKLDAGAALGYSAAGTVVGVGRGAAGYRVGDRVAVAGVGFANHASFADVPVNLATPVPQYVSIADASTVAIGSIAMQGVRRADLRLGEFCVVIGAGIIGLIVLQMLRAAGVRVAVVDIDAPRLRIAEEYGAELVVDATKDDSTRAVVNWTGGYGVDVAIFSASTPSSGPLSDAFNMCRKKARVILLGVSGMNIKREDIYQKELDFMISTSYGPGRYDDRYEERGLDYPYHYVRWTEGRNMAEYLRMIGSGKINLAPLIQGEYEIEEVSRAYESLSGDGERPLIVLLRYPQSEPKRAVRLPIAETAARSGALRIAVVGAGSFATSMHLPHLVEDKRRFEVRAICNRRGQSSVNVATQFGVPIATSNINEVLEDSEIDAVMIATRHELHAQIAISCIRAGKHVFVEKPLATTLDELAQIEAVYDEIGTNAPVLFVGFNRRFSPCVQAIKTQTSNRIGPLFIHYQMNAGFLPDDHWVFAEGGRIVGEACHLIDLMSALVGHPVASVSVQSLGVSESQYRARDNVSLALQYTDGSIATINYFSLGSKARAKETMEVHFDGKTILMDDYKDLRGLDVQIPFTRSPASEKGQREELGAFYDAIMTGGSWPIPFESLIETTRVSLIASA